MLSVAKVSSGSADYYAKDNYYAKTPEGTSGSIERSTWFGRGAREVALIGAVERGAFASVMSGQVPNGPLLGRMVEGERKHTPGHDLTFSAPKSVSVLIEVLGNKAAAAAHDKAVLTALTFVENKVLRARVYDPATRAQKPIGDQNMVAALFRHDVSRALDPQTHTHAVIANMAKGADDKWRSVHSPSLFQNKMLVGAIYRSELATQLKSLGFGLTRTHADGRFEIAGVPQSLMKAYSTRAADIEAALQGREDVGPEAAARAALITRDTKVHAERSELGALWQTRAKAAGIDLDAVAKEVATPRTPTKAIGPQEIIASTLEHLSERASAFSKTDLQRAAIGLATGVQSPAKILSEIDSAAADGRVIEGVGTVKGKLTTTAADARERQTVAAMKAGRSAVDPITTTAQIDKAMEPSTLSEEQRGAVKHLMNGANRTIGVQGHAGTGKTTMLTEAVKIARMAGLNPIGLAPSSAAAQVLSEAGLETLTLQKFLTVHKDGATDFTDNVIILDEASMASTKQMNALLTVANAGNARRLALIGDTKQLGAVEAGAPFQALQNAGMDTALMTDIRRQRDPEQLDAVKAIAAGRLHDAFKRIDGNILETERANLPRAAADQWIGLSQAARERTAIIAPTHALRGAVTQHLRAALKKEGVIGAHDTMLQTDRALHLTQAEKRRPESYQPGQAVLFRTGDPNLGLERGERLTVSEAAPKDGMVRLEGQTGDMDWRPEQTPANGIEVFEPRGLDVADGDVVRWTRNDESQRFLNSDIARIDQIDDERVQFTTEQGERVTLALDDPQLRYLDHAWTSTLHTMQGRTVDRVIALSEASHPHLTTQKAFYVAISRARENVTLITDDKTLLRDTLEQQTGEKLAALDLTPERAEPDMEQSNDRADSLEDGPDLGPNDREYDDRELELELEIEGPNLDLEISL